LRFKDQVIVLGLQEFHEDLVCVYTYTYIILE